MSRARVPHADREAALLDDCLCCFKRPASNEDAELAERRLLRRIEQTVAPVDGVAKGEMPCWNIPPLFRRKQRLSPEPAQHCGRGEDMTVDRRDPDRERDAVEPVQERGQSTRIRCCDHPPRLNAPGVCQKERRGGRLYDRVRIDGA